MMGDSIPLNMISQSGIEGNGASHSGSIEGNVAYLSLASHGNEASQQAIQGNGASQPGSSQVNGS